MNRSALIDVLDDALRPLGYVRAVWLGGSDASGRTDELSDIDLVVVARDEHVEDVFPAIESAITSVTSIDHRYRLPSPTWHGHEQAIWQVVDPGPFVHVDLVVMKLSSGDRLLERERHGEPVVLLDRDGIVVAPPLDRAAHDQRMQKRLVDILARFPLFQSLVLKAIERGHAAEAMQWYRGMTLVPLVELLRIRHCPDRFDFGLRYLDRDLPPELAATIDRLSYAADMETLREHLTEAATLFATHS